MCTPGFRNREEKPASEMHLKQLLRDRAGSQKPQWAHRLQNKKKNLVWSLACRWSRTIISQHKLLKSLTACFPEGLMAKSPTWENVIALELFLLALWPGQYWAVSAEFLMWHNWHLFSWSYLYEEQVRGSRLCFPNPAIALAPFIIPSRASLGEPAGGKQIERRWAEEWEMGYCRTKTVPLPSFLPLSICSPTLVMPQSQAASLDSVDPSGARPCLCKLEDFSIGFVRSEIQGLLY